MDATATKHILEAALLAANTNLSFDKLADLFTARGVDVDRDELRASLLSLSEDYKDRQIELKETASGFRIQVRSSAREWLQPLFEERAPRYTRALLETLALIAYRQPITRAEIEEVRGVVVSSNITRTLMERGWIRIVGHREVPGRPAMLGTTKEFLDYFGLKRLEDLPPLAELRELGPQSDPQSDLVDELEAVMAETEGKSESQAESEGEAEADSESESESESEAADQAEVVAEFGPTAAPSGDLESDPEDVAASDSEPESAPESATDEESTFNVVPIQQSEA